MKKSKFIYGIMGIYILIAAAAILVMVKNSRKEPDAQQTFLEQETTSTAPETADNELEQRMNALEQQLASQEAAVGTKAEPETTEGVETTEGAVTNVYVVKGVSSVNLRSAPDKQSELLAALPEGTSGIVLERGDYYSYVQYKELTGYVYNEYLEIFEKIIYLQSYGGIND